jgi:hypothetical protein
MEELATATSAERTALMASMTEADQQTAEEAMLRTAILEAEEELDLDDGRWVGADAAWEVAPPYTPNPIIISSPLPMGFLTLSFFLPIFFYLPSGSLTCWLMRW